MRCDEPAALETTSLPSVFSLTLCSPIDEIDVSLLCLQDHKTLYYDVDPFLFYVLCEKDVQG